MIDHLEHVDPRLTIPAAIYGVLHLGLALAVAIFEYVR